MSKMSVTFVSAVLSLAAAQAVWAQDQGAPVVTPPTSVAAVPAATGQAAAVLTSQASTPPAAAVAPVAATATPAAVVTPPAMPTTTPPQAPLPTVAPAAKADAPAPVVSPAASGHAVLKSVSKVKAHEASKAHAIHPQGEPAKLSTASQSTVKTRK